MKKNGILFIPALLLIFALAFSTFSGCGSGGGGGGGGDGSTPSTTDLKGALNPTLSIAPVVSAWLKRQNGDNIANAAVSYSFAQNIIGTEQMINAGFAVSDANGIASLALPAGSYTRDISALPAGVGDAQYSITVTSDSTQTDTHQANERAWDITSPVDLDNATVTVYRSDASGMIDWDSSPQVLQATEVPDPALLTSVTVNTELFEGNYRVTVTGSPVDTNDALALYVSNVITIAGGGGSSTIQLNLSQAGNVLTLTLMDDTGNGLEGYALRAYDNSTLLLLGTASTDVNGVGSILVDAAFTDVAVKIDDNVGNFAGVYRFADLAADSAETLTQRQVSGIVSPASGSLDANDVASITIQASSGLNAFFDEDLPGVAMTQGTGVFTATLLGSTGGLSYVLSAAGVAGFPDATPVTVAVAGSGLSDTSITVATGGVIYGRIQDEAGNNLQNVTVLVYDAGSDDFVGSDQTDAAGIYSIEVPYGTFDMFAGGAATEDISITASANSVEKNLTRYQLTGGVIDSNGLRVAALVTSSGGNATANSVGIYTLDMVEGTNWICFAPPADRPTLGLECTFNVVVDDATIASLGSKPEESAE